GFGEQPVVPISLRVDGGDLHHPALPYLAKTRQGTCPNIEDANGRAWWRVEDLSDQRLQRAGRVGVELKCFRPGPPPPHISPPKPIPSPDVPGPLPVDGGVPPAVQDGKGESFPGRCPDPSGKPVCFVPQTKSEFDHCPSPLGVRPTDRRNHRI